MAKDPAPPKKPNEISPDWEQSLYSEERVNQWLSGKLSLKELSAVSGPEMLQMAVVGFARYEQGRYDDAKTIFTGLSQLDPEESYYRTALGAVYLAEEDLEMAEKSFEIALNLNPKDIASRVNRGEVFLRQGRILEAAQDFKRAVELDPQNKDPLSRRAKVLAAAALETLDAARKEASKTKPSGQTAAPAGKPAAPPAPKAQAKPSPASPSKKK